MQSGKAGQEQTDERPNETNRIDANQNEGSAQRGWSGKGSEEVAPWQLIEHHVQVSKLSGVWDCVLSPFLSSSIKTLDSA